MSELKYVRFFEELGIDDVPLVGGKNASLGEMYTELSGDGVRVPNGFATTSQAYRDMLEEANAWEPLHAALDGLTPEDVAGLAPAGKRAREIVYGAGLPEELAREIIAAYRRLQEEYGEDVSLAVRSSATAEDLPTASFAGPAGDLPQHPRRREPARRLPPLLRQPVHGPRDPLPHRPGLRPLRRRAVDRNHEDDPLRPRRFRRLLLARHRVGLPRRGLHHRRLRARRERRAGSRRPGRVLRPQAHLRGGPPRRPAPPAGRQGGEDDLRRGRDQAHGPQRPDPEGRPRALLHQRRGRPRARRLRDQDRTPLRPTHGHGVGQGRPRRQALSRPGAARDGRLAAQRHRPGELCPGGARRDHHRGPLGRGEDRLRRCARDQGGHAALRLQARRGPGRRHHHAGLGAGDEDRRGDRHQSRRAHLPRGDHRPRARHPGGGGHRGCHHLCAQRRDRHHLLHRGRYRARLPRRGALPRRPHRGGRPRPPVHRDHGQPRQPGSRLQDLVPAQRRRRAGAHGVHRQRVHQGPTRWPCCTPRRSPTRRRARRSRA